MLDRSQKQRRSTLRLATVSAAAALGLLTSAQAADREWGTGAPAADDTITFTGDKTDAVTLDADTAAAGVTFATKGSAAITIGGDHALTLGDGGVIKKSAASDATNQTIAVPLTLAGSATFTNDNKWVHMANQLILSGQIHGGGAIDVTGSGDGGVTLAADNSTTFHGAITVSSGMLFVASTGALGDTAAGTRMTGGELFFGGVNTAEPFAIGGKALWESIAANEQSGPIQLESGATWTIGNGGGNTLVLNGVLSGAADAEIVMNCGNTTLGGNEPNTFAGKIAHASNSGTDLYNELRLAKPSGVAAIAGPLAITNKAAIVWKADDQIDDAAAIAFGGGVLEPHGHHDKLGVLTLNGRGRINFTGGGTLTFAASSDTTWADKSQLLIGHWDASSAHLTIGDSAAALTPAQLAMIGFSDPAGKPKGLYHAQISPAGVLSPTDAIVKPSGVAYDVSSAAQASRAKLYEVAGLQQLTAKGVLKRGEVIDFFGDSITWLNVWATKIQDAVTQSPATKDLEITFHNRGVNGGGAAQIRDGSPNAAFGTTDNNGPQAPFAEVIAADHATMAVLYIGINDVTWRNTTPDDFRKQLSDIAAAAKKQGTRLTIATLSVHGELPNGKNADDAKCDQYAQITREVAAAEKVPLVDLRKAYIAFEQNNNGDLQLDGSLLSKPSGILTYDSIHPTQRGNELLANLIADGLTRAAKGH